MINVMEADTVPLKKRMRWGGDGVLVGICVNLGVIRALGSAHVEPSLSSLGASWASTKLIIVLIGRWYSF